MRRLTKQETYKRGCDYCLHHVKIRESLKSIPYMGNQQEKEKRKGYRGSLTKKYVRGLSCKFDCCPYTELDQYKNYREYLKHKEGIF